MVHKQTTDFDGFESLHAREIDTAPTTRTRAFGLVTMSLLILGALTAFVAIAIGAVLEVPVLIGLVLLNN